MDAIGPKPLVRFGGRALIEAALRPYLDSSLHEVLVVLGYAAEQVRACLPACEPRLRVLENPEWQLGLGQSIAFAISELAPATDRILLGLADMPWLSPSLVEQIIQCPATQPVVAPHFQGRRGHPVRFDRRWFSALAGLRGDQGAGRLMQRRPAEVHLLEVVEEAILRDVDEPAQLSE